MSLNNYPYFIYGLYKRIIKEKDYAIKFFLLIDLFNSLLRFTSFILNRKYQKQDKNLLKQLHKLSTKTIEPLSLLILKEYKNLEFIDEQINIILKEIDKQKKEFIEQEYFKDNFIKIFNILKKTINNINNSINFELLIPLELRQNFINCVNISGESIKLSNIFNDFNYSLKKLNSENNLILKFKESSEISTIKLLPDKKTNSSLNYKEVEFLINEFSYNIIGDYLYKIQLNKTNIPEKSLKYDDQIFIKRDSVSDKLNKFIRTKDSGYFFIVGTFGTGKSTALKSLEDENSNFSFYKTTIDKNSYKKNLKEIVNELIGKDIDIDNSQDFLKLFHNIKEKTKKIIIFEDIHLIDKVDELLKLFPQKLPENIYIFFSMAARESVILPMLENRELYYIPAFSYSETKTLVTRILNYKNIFYSNDIEEIIKKTYGFPLFIKILLLQSEYFTNRKKDIEKKFLNLINQLENYTLRYDKKLNNYTKYFFTLLSISKDGFTKSEIVSILPAISNILIETYIDKSSEFLVKVNSRYRLSSYVFEDICEKNLCSKDELNFLHNKIIEFYEPWDKKINSQALKFLPYHYLELKNIDKVKSLMSSSFIKSKFKIFPKETLSDISLLIKELINSKSDLYEIFNFSFIHQRLKDSEKREFMYILDLAEEGDFLNIINKSFSINKPFERFLELLIISYLAIDNKQYFESRQAIKKLMSIPNIFINSNNSEIIFKMSAEILSQGVFDIINLPKNREDGVNVIKHLKETEFSYKVIEIILKLLDGLSNEIDKSVMLEALLNKVIDFQSFIIIEKFYKEIISIIDRINNDNIRDRLYHVYILCILKKSDIYNIFLNNLLEIKDKVKTSLFKYLFYSSLSVFFIKLKQEKISYDFLLKSIAFIEELENLNHIPFMISNLIFTMKNYESTYFYNEIIEKVFNLIADISFNYEGLQSKLNLINSTLEPNLYKDEIKSIINQIIKFNIDGNITFIKSYISALYKIKDKRTFNSLYNKILKNIDKKSEINKINMYLSIMEFGISEDLYNEFKILLTNNNETRIKITQVIDFITNKNIFSSEITDIVMQLILSLDKDNSFSQLLISIIQNMDKKNISPADKFSENIYNICNEIESTSDKLKVLINLSYFLINSSQKDAGLQLIRKIYSVILSEDDITKFQVIKESLDNISNIRESYSQYYIFSDILVNIYNISHYIKNDEIIVKISEEIFKNATKLNFSDLKNIFYRNLEFANKIVNANTKMQIVNLVRKYLVCINEKNFIIDILQKSILISEENFSDNDLKLMSISSLAYINRMYGDIDRGKQLFNRFINEIRFSSYDEYISESMIHVSKFIHKIDKKEECISLYKGLIENEIYINNEYYLFNTYTNIINNLTKIANLKDLYSLYIQLIKISIRLDNPNYKSEYLIALVSAITNFKLTRQSLELLNKVFSLSYFIKDEKYLSNFYKSFIISINKSLSRYSLSNLDSFSQTIEIFLKSMEKSIDNTIKSTSLKAEMFSLLGLAYYKFDKVKNKKDSFFKSSIQLIKEIQENENKVGIETLTALRIIATKDTKQGNKILQNIVNTINLQKEDKDKFSLFEIFVSYKNHIDKSENYKELIEYLINDGLEFKTNIFKNKMYIFAFIYYYENKDIEKMYKYIEKAEKSIKEDESYDSTEQKINLVINLINISQINKANEVLKNVIESIKNKPKRIMYELIIKVFNQLSYLTKDKYKAKLFENILEQIEKLELKEIAEQDLYILANSYSNIKNIDKFNYVLLYTDNFNQKEKLIDLFIDNLSYEEDYDNLIKLLPLTLFSVRLTDKIIASILLLVNDKNKIKLLNENILI